MHAFSDYQFLLTVNECIFLTSMDVEEQHFKLYKITQIVPCSKRMVHISHTFYIEGGGMLHSFMDVF